MSTSIAHTRQQLSALIAAAQQQPQVISNRNRAVAVLVSADYFAQSEAAAKPITQSFYTQVMHLRETWSPDDDMGLTATKRDVSRTSWQRGNDFTDPN